MAAAVSALRVSLLSDEQGRWLPTPAEVNVATDQVPYGSTVRLEIDVESEGLVHPLGVQFLAPGIEYEARTFLYPISPSGSFAGEVLVPCGLISGVTESPGGPPHFPLPEWPTRGPLVLAGGDYALRVTPVPVGTSPSWPMGSMPPKEAPLSRFETMLHVAPPLSPGGAAPTIASLSSTLTDPRVRVGQPWLLTARVEDPDDDVLGVVCSTLRGGIAYWWRLRDDGEMGDEQARDGVYSFIRCGGDYWDHHSIAAGQAPVTLSVHAVDVRGNWSEPAVMDYVLDYEQPPLWQDEPAADAPAIAEVGVVREQGAVDLPRVWAKCAGTGLWVCAHILGSPGETGVLLDDGKGPDPAAGDGVHSGAPAFGRGRPWDIIFYAVPKSGPPRIGRTATAICPALP